MNIYKYIFCSHHQRIITVCGVVEMLYNALTFMMRPLVLAIVVNMLWGLFTQRSSHVICYIKGHAMLLVRYWYALRICQMFLHCLIWILDFLLFCFIISPMYYIPWSLFLNSLKTQPFSERFQLHNVTTEYEFRQVLLFITYHLLTSKRVSGGLSLTAFLQTVDIEVHIMHISRVIITYTLESLSSLT